MRAIILILALPTACQAELCRVSIPRGGNARFGGHGVYIGQNIVLTAKHVISGARGYARVTFLETGKTVRAVEHAASQRFDLAGLRLDPPEGAKPTAITDKWPDGPVSSFRSRGMPRRGARNGRGHEIFSWSGHAVSGDSGGPVKNEAGQVVSLVCYGDGRETHGPPPDQIVEFVQRWREKRGQAPST